MASMILISNLNHAHVLLLQHDWLYEQWFVASRHVLTAALLSQTIKANHDQTINKLPPPMDCVILFCRHFGLDVVVIGFCD